MPLLGFLLSLFLLIISACSSDKSSSSFVDNFQDDDDLVSIPEDFEKIHAAGKFTYLGTKDSSAKKNEQPQMKVGFSYNFAIGKHEVTCGEFNELMSGEFGEDVPDVECENDSLPVTDVTYYDAVLFANARSKKENRDTVYTYIGKILDSEGHCTSLEGIVFQPSKNGYRLPLEAEWVYVASTIWNTDYSWNANNSNYEAHKICSVPNRKSSICDMKGNVMEWVNDWLSHFKDTTITDYAGAPTWEGFGERVVKGGSFRDTPSAIKLYNRGDVYIVTSSTHANYVGFRLALGTIDNPSWMGKKGNVTNSRIIPLANSGVIKKVTGDTRRKIVFRDDVTGNLTFIDYTQGQLTFEEIHDTIPAFHPEISPDGKKVAFSTIPEGVPGISSVYVRDLNVDGSNLVKLNVKAAAIPRWRVLDNGDTAIVYVTSQENNKNSESFKNSSTWQVVFKNGAFETPKKLTDGAFHGGISKDNRLAVTGARLLRARFSEKGDIQQSSARDTLWYNGEQACNVSLAKDGSKRTLFLDFAGSTGQEFVGKTYRTHERLFIADSNGKLIQSIAAPSRYTFDHTEWASDSIVIATLTNINGAHEKIALINTNNSSITELIEGEELWHPNLWVDHNTIFSGTLDLDSAGYYRNPENEWSSLIMRNKMELLWRFHDSINVAVLGSSRPLYSISPSVLSKEFFAVNFAHVPNSIYATRDYLDKYLYRHLKKLKYIVLSLDIDFWFKQDGPEGDNFFVKDVAEYPGYVYDANHNYWDDGVPDGLLEATVNNFSTPFDSIYLHDKGHFEIDICQSWGDSPETVGDSTIYDVFPNLIENSMDALISILNSAANRDITVIGIIFPQSPLYRESGAFGRYGLRRSRAVEIIKQLSNLHREYPNFVFMDENKMGEHDYTDEMAVDHDHLCSVGAIKITSRLDSLLKTLK